MGKVIIYTVLVAAALWAGYWLAGYSALRGGIETWFEDRRAQGWEARYEELTVRGFPNRFDATFTAPALVDPASGLGWSAPFLQVFALSYRPGHVIAVWPREQTLRTSAGTFDLRAGDMRANVDFAGIAQPQLERIIWVAKDAELRKGVETLAAAPSLMFSTRRHPAAEAARDVYVDVQGLSLGDATRAMMDPGRQLPPAIDRLRVDAMIEFDRPWDIRAMTERRPRPVALRLTEASVVWGDIRVTATGELAVDASGALDGSLTLAVSDWARVLALAVRAGLIEAEAEPALAAALLAAGAVRLPVAVTFRDGLATMSGLPLGPAPRLVLP